MITQLTLNTEQLTSLANQIEDLYTSEGIVVTGIEIAHVQDEEDCCKVFFSYEDAQDRLRRTSIYFAAVFGANAVTDFEEVHFEDGQRIH